MKNVKYVLIIHPEEIRHEKIVSYSDNKNDIIIDCNCFAWVERIMNWRYQIVDCNGNPYDGWGAYYFPYKAKFTLDILDGIHHEKITEIPVTVKDEKFYQSLEAYVKCECIEWAENFMDWYVEDIIKTN